jgi:two-component system phosphate regulon sensor histidine kinase PhoR
MKKLLLFPMHKLKNIKWLPILMAASILTIAAFQFYWLRQTYDREERTLEMRTNGIFRETVRGVQVSKLKLDRVDTSKTSRILIQPTGSDKPIRVVTGPVRMESMIDVMMQKIRDSSKGTQVVVEKNLDTAMGNNKVYAGRRDRMIQFLFDMDSLQDSLTVKELDSAYAKKLDEQNIDVPYSIKRVAQRDTTDPRNEVTLGFSHPITYRLDLSNTTGYLMKRISVPILFSVFLVGFTILSFSLLYRNLLKQRRLADIKNEFISNITHELKTPIATVSVAIEALRSFNANLDAARTKEYLDISANELLRLSLLVDKVLKLSMFEKKEVDLQYEPLDMKSLVDEVTSSMRLQFEKQHAQVDVKTNGDTHFEGDRLHLVSVIFNLIDNALKYSSGKPTIAISMNGNARDLHLEITDSGIGIPSEYQDRIFEKFFRVPTGNLHNAKGYGLGLSYVAHVIRRHKGNIKVESVEGDGSKFMISLPRHKA